ncbi:MAG: pyridoxal-dependent decarboxylase [Marinovum sp.]|nr:pyridoxal-dependent decarboxylase [Marinovum sp.]
MTPEEFEDWSRKAAAWGVEYRAKLGDLPVRAQVKPGDILAQLPKAAPEQGDSMEAIMADVDAIILPGVTHWQHPRFFAYFPANAAPVSVVAEYICSAMAAQCMLWQTSPAATELETAMVGWLRDAMGLPTTWSGVIQDSASSATLSAVLTMRERATGYTGNREGLHAKGHLRIYCSEQAHSSIDRACWVAGVGQNNLVKIPSHPESPYQIDTDALHRAITADRAAGHVPAGIIAITGGTSIGAWDDLQAVGAIAKAEDLYLHLDAAWAGAAMICPEYAAEMWPGVEQCDSVVFNPHKWMGAQFDCSVQFLKDPTAQLNTLKIEPEYLKTHGQEVTNYSEWTIPLGRRFRALKLWFLMRYHGLEDLRNIMRNHVRWSQDLCERLRATPGVEITSEPILSLFSFKAAGASDAETIAAVNAINDKGVIYLTQTLVDGRSAIRFQAGSFAMHESDADVAYNEICQALGAA